MTKPRRYQEAKYEDVPREIRELFERIGQTRRGMYIHGDVGTGKTHIAYAMRDRWDSPERGRYAMFQNATELLREIRQDFDRENQDKTRIADRVMVHEGLLFIDDVGAEKITDWVAETFYLIVNRRYNDVLPTVFTSNMPIADLAERIGDRTASRIVEMCDVVELVGPDRRITNQKKTVVKL